ncbi:MAG: hypothetical protein IPQ21_22370 [Betaproteobacteria bacterium]|nr:hypothetical protein [Betaproteobacteria bacterium]
MLRELPPGRVAAIRFSGIWSDAIHSEHLALLRAALKTAKPTVDWRPSLRATTRRSRLGSCAATRSGWRCD